jgi:5'-methylthioadenosine phosphorylase
VYCGTHTKIISNFDSYALIATSTDYDSWRPQSEAVTAADVFKTLKANADTSRLVAATVLEELHIALSSNDASIAEVIREEKGSMKFSIMPRSEKQNPADRQKLAFVLPEYFAGEEGADIGNAGKA